MPSDRKKNSTGFPTPKDNLSLISNGKFKKNPWVHLFRSQGKIALYNPLSQDVFYGNDNLLNLVNRFEKPEKITDLNLDKSQLNALKDLVDTGIIVKERYDAQDEIKNLQKAVNDKFKISLMYLVLSNKCNYSCEYCFVTKDEIKVSRKMSKQIISDSFDMLSELIGEGGSAKVVFYGGEPLLNENLIKFVLTEERKRIESSKGITFEFEMITNGSLVTKQTSDLLAKERVNVSVSIDGWEEIHNTQRKTKSGHGTFKDSIRGYNLLKEAGCEPGISCTISYGNYKHLPNIVQYFAKCLKPSAIGINPQLNEIFSPKMEYIFPKLLEAFKVARSEGIYEDRIIKIIQPFIEKYIRLADCGACGNQIVISPGGMVGVCPAFSDDSMFFPEHVSSKKFYPYQHELFKEWGKRSPFTMEMCRSCPAITVCGGGCPYLAFIENETIWMPNKANCMLSRNVLEWAIWEGERNSGDIQAH